MDACDLCKKRWEGTQEGNFHILPKALTRCDFERRVKEKGDFIWITAHQAVYCIPREWAANVHPGGARSLLSHHGNDCSEDYDFHSPQTRIQIWVKFKEGDLVPCTGPKSCSIQ